MCDMTHLYMWTTKQLMRLHTLLKNWRCVTNPWIMCDMTHLYMWTTKQLMRLHTLLRESKVRHEPLNHVWHDSSIYVDHETADTTTHFTERIEGTSRTLRVSVTNSTCVPSVCRPRDCWHDYTLYWESWRCVTNSTCVSHEFYVCH